MKIEKCPFCGGEAILESNKLRYGTTYSAYCQKCGAEITGFSEHKAIAAWNSRTGKDINVATNADRIRAMSDEELATWILENIDCDKENIMCIPALYKNSDKCDGRCRDGRLSWLKQPLKEE